ncbi:MAG: anaerobic sulfatase maturase [Candidatus Glassbacteria bacterium RIFCSPLOWO2_12_FULL_58_11]|uniref:Anaerobic sulfatase maturase n=1 Tax=Candidatus Glassbacteria bacterium RIFCSPLOWO2_12_FULL_58_11 TaxID=1817867 RepID=A0A1F5YM87_9BACT|nr:MAG: anaerobic sulfatase maturase [Candidatus Glassbacteria bacterium RIFCSPLOWO2_12_FULL_58_11]
MLDKPLKPFSLLIKPVGSRCNLNCDYCFYLGTDESLGGPRPAVMPVEVLERLCEDFLGYGFPTSVFTWQGGEPTLAGLDFYRKAVETQMRFGRGGQAVANALQTNALLIDHEWADFLARYRFLVGVSLDGPPELHDSHRKDRRGKPTFDRVMQGIAHLREAGVEFNILCMITSLSQSRGRGIYRFLVAGGFTHLQFIPCAEYDPATGAPSPLNVSPAGYGRFMCDIFDEWYNAGDTHRISVRTFDAIVGRLAGAPQLSLCNFGDRCDHYLVVEKDGGVYPCDFFVEKKYALGNLMQSSLAGLFQSDRERSFSRLKCSYPDLCLRCPHLDLCFGGCPKDRLSAGGGRFGKPSYLCEGLKIFFEHTRGKFQELADSVNQSAIPGAAPAKGRSAAVSGAASGRNAPCPCGSGKKYKHCCLRK